MHACRKDTENSREDTELCYLPKISNVANGEESMLDNPSRKASYSFNDVNIEYHLKLNVKQNSNDDQLETHGAANIIGNDQENGLKARIETISSYGDYAP